MLPRVTIPHGLRICLEAKKGGRPARAAGGRWGDAQEKPRGSGRARAEVFPASQVLPALAHSILPPSYSRTCTRRSIFVWEKTAGQSPASPG